MPRVIITGGTGLIGQRLQEMLREKGHEPAILTRRAVKTGEYKWDPEKKYIDPEVFDNASAIIHLAGTGIADKPLTRERKKEIISSRSGTAELLFSYLQNHQHAIKSFISASAVGYYGDGKDRWLTESSPNGSGFAAEVCRPWEAAADRFTELGLRVAKLRTGIVFSKDGGALPQMARPVRFCLGTYFGDGTQFISWIHIDDICRAYIHLLEHENLSGPYNACTPEPVTNKALTAAIAKALNRPALPLPTPAFLLKLLLGERADLLLMSDRCSPEKILETGFDFHFPDLHGALQNIYH